MKFKDILPILRKEKKVSQQDIGNLVGISSQAVSKWESGNSEPDNESLIRIANFFDVSVDYLLGNDTQIKNLEHELKEKELLKELLIKNGYMKPGEDLTKEELDKLMKFINANKEFIKENK